MVGIDRRVAGQITFLIQGRDATNLVMLAQRDTVVVQTTVILVVAEGRALGVAKKCPPLTHLNS